MSDWRQERVARELQYAEYLKGYWKNKKKAKQLAYEQAKYRVTYDGKNADAVKALLQKTGGWRTAWEYTDKRRKRYYIAGLQFGVTLWPGDRIFVIGTGFDVIEAPRPQKELPPPPDRVNTDKAERVKQLAIDGFPIKAIAALVGYTPEYVKITLSWWQEVGVDPKVFRKAA